MNWTEYLQQIEKALDLWEITEEEYNLLIEKDGK